MPDAATTQVGCQVNPGFVEFQPCKTVSSHDDPLRLPVWSGMLCLSGMLPYLICCHSRELNVRHSVVD